MTDTTRVSDPTPGMPRWVKVSLIIVAVLVVAFVVLKVTNVGGGPGGHGPGRHMPSGLGGRALVDPV